MTWQGRTGVVRLGGHLQRRIRDVSVLRNRIVSNTLIFMAI